MGLNVLFKGFECFLEYFTPRPRKSILAPCREKFLRTIMGSRSALMSTPCHFSYKVKQVVVVVVVVLI